MGSFFSSPAEPSITDTEVTPVDAATTTEATSESSAEVEAVTDITPPVSEDPVSTDGDAYVTEASYATEDDSDDVSQPGVTMPATATVATVPVVGTTITDTSPEKDDDSEETLTTPDRPAVTQEVTVSKAPAGSTESTEDTDSGVVSISPSPSSSEKPDSDEKEESAGAVTESISPSFAASEPTTPSTTTKMSPFPPYPGTVRPTTPTTTTPMTYGPGACVFNGKVYASAQQIPRDDPCDFCFCFRGDIICLQQSCPPPIPNCYEEGIPGFCCPRYECPVVQTRMNVTTTTTPLPTYPPVQQQVEMVMCEIGNRYYHQGQLVDEASGPCLECR